MWMKRAGTTGWKGVEPSWRVGSVLTAASAASRESLRTMCEKVWTFVAPVLGGV